MCKRLFIVLFISVCILPFYCFDIAISAERGSRSPRVQPTSGPGGLVDISDDTNLTVTDPVTLTDDDLGFNTGWDGTLASLILTNLTPLRLIATDANKKLVSTLISAWIAGTVGEITVTDDGDGSVTLSMDGSFVANQAQKDLVSGTGLTGGEDNVLVGVDSDLTLNVVAGDGVIANADEIEVYGLVASDGIPNDAVVTDASGDVIVNYTLGAASGTTVNEFSIDGTFGGNSDDALPTEKAVKTYVDAQIGGAANDTYVEEGDVARVDTTGADMYLDFDDTDFGIGVIGNEGNVTITDDGHTHTGVSLSGIDISDDTNLAVTVPITLTDDTVGITIAKDLVAGNGLTGGEDDVFPKADADVTITVGAGDGVIANADEIEIYGLVALDGDPTDAVVVDANGNVVANYTLGASVGTTVNEFSIDGTLVGNSDDVLPTEQAVKTYVDAQVGAVGLRWDEIDNPNAAKTFNMTTNPTSFAFTNPSGGPTYDGAFEIQANGAFVGDLLHVHQHTGNPGATTLVSLEAEDVDVTPLSVVGVGAINSEFTGGVVKLNDSIVFTPSTAQVINAVGDTIDPDGGTVVLNPDADYTLTSTPSILAGTYEGQEFHLRCANGEANTVTLQDITELVGTTLRLKGDTTIITGQAITSFVWDGTDWIEEGAQTVNNIKKLTIINELNIPSDDDPATDAVTELAFDTNDDALEIYDGVQSVLIPTRRSFQVVFADPDALQALTDGWPLLNIKVADYPHGIVIENLWLSTDQVSTYDAAFEEWTTPTSGSASVIETVSTSASTEADDDGVDNPIIEAGNYVFLDMDTDDLIWVMVGGTFRITEGN